MAMQWLIVDLNLTIDSLYFFQNHQTHSFFIIYSYFPLFGLNRQEMENFNYIHQLDQHPSCLFFISLLTLNVFHPHQFTKHFLLLINFREIGF